MDLKDRVVLVTGAGRGIGRAIAVAFAREGAHLGLMGRTKKGLAEAQEEIGPLGVRSVLLPGDVSEEGTVSRCVIACEQELGPIDVLVNNAGIYASGPIDKLDAAVFDRLIAVNLRGPFLTTRAVLPGMKSRRRGHIVNIASTAGKRGFANGAAYCASKFGLAGLSEATLAEARPFDVRVTTVYPSTVLTDLARGAGIVGKDPARAIHPEDVAEAVVALVKLQGRCMPTSIEIWQTNP